MQEHIVPKGLFVQFEGVPSLVRPKVEYLGKEARKMPELARQDGLHQLYTDDIVKVYRQLGAAEEDGYSSLAEAQSLVHAGKVAADEMADILSRFGDEVLHSRLMWSELLDWQPQKRAKGYKLPKGANAVLYRGWGLSGNAIDISGATTIPVKWMTREGDVSKEIVKQLDVPEDTHVWADKEYSVENVDGLSTLEWNFTDRERPSLGSYWIPQYGHFDGGALPGSPLSADEMVRVFEAPEAKAEGPRKVAEVLEKARKYDALRKDFRRLEKDLEEIKKHF